MKYLFLPLLLCTSFSLLSQQPTIDSLREELSELKSDTALIERAIDLAILLEGRHPDSAQLLCQQAKALALAVQPPTTRAMALRKVGMGYRQIRQLDTALILFKQGLKIAEDHDFLDGRAFIHNSIGNLYYIKDEPQLALQQFEQAYTLHQAREDKDEQTATLNNMAIIHMEQGNFEKAIPLYEKALLLQEAIGNKIYQAMLQTNLALCYRNMDHFEQAITMFQKSSATFKEIGNKSGQAKTLGILGSVYKNQGNYVRALALFQESLKLRKSQGNKKAISTGLINFGGVYKELGDYTKSIANYQEALDTLKVLADRPGQALVLNRIGENLKLQGSYLEALKNLHAALAIRREVGPERLIPAPLFHIGDTYEKMDQLDSAEYYLRESLQVSMKLKDTQFETLALTTLGRVYRKKQQIPAAITTLERAYALSPENTYQKEKLDISRELYALYKSQNNLSKALLYHERYKAFQDSLFNEANTKAITRLESEYEFAQEKQQLEHEQEKEIMAIDGQLRRQRTFQLVMGIALFIALVLIFIIARYYRLKRRANEELQSLNEEILAQKDRLQELDHRKSHFFTNISHEFRTPLTVISGMAVQIQGQENIKHLIQRNSDNLLNLVHQILDLRKLETGGLDLQLIQSDIVFYLRYLLESFHSLAKDKGIKLHFLSDEPEFLMDFDQEKILRIVSNLLSNAIKFTPENGNVYLRLTVDHTRYTAGRAQREAFPPVGELRGASLLISIQDTGLGIAEDQLPHIFDRFYQVASPGPSKGAENTRPAEGTGIGLSLTKELVKLMEGQIQVESQVNEGTTFTVSLPIRRQAKLMIEPEDMVFAAGQPHEPTNDIGPLPIAAAAAKSGQGLSMDQVKSNEGRPSLLIIEDNPDVVVYLESILEDKYQIRLARDGQEGVERALELIPDLILSDVMIPCKDGFVVCETLKKDLRTSHIPIVLLTAKADVESRIAGLEHGADAYLAKPFHQKELLVRLEKLLVLRKILQERYQTQDWNTRSEDPAIRREDEFIARVREAVEAHIDDEDFAVEELCRSVGISRSQLHTKLKAITGRPTTHYIHLIRMQKAKDLLLSQAEMKMIHIGMEVGYPNPSHFSRLFKKEFGLSPSEFRKQKKC